ncbi:MAG: glycerol-3-phosphate acyltransferase, partial [Parvibaculum sp.]
GQTLDAIMSSRNAVTEGVHSATAVVELAAMHKIEMPIAEAVASIVTGKASDDEAIKTLLTRPFKSENEFS